MTLDSGGRVSSQQALLGIYVSQHDLWGCDSMVKLLVNNYIGHQNNTAIIIANITEHLGRGRQSAR